MQYASTVKFIRKTPLAWIPISMSLAALALVLIYLVAFGVSTNSQGDEGAAAHIFQLLMGGQLPVIAFFVIKYFQKKPREVGYILIIQIIAGILAFVPVFILERML